MSAQPSDHLPESPRILLADDSQSERRLASELLREAGYEVDEAADGAAVLLYLRNRAFDLLLLDLHMPGMDGFEVLSQLQRGHADLPIILMTGLSPDQIQQDMQRLRLHTLPPLLMKPVNADQLLSVVALRLRGELPA